MAAKWGFNNDYGLVNDFIRRFVPNFQYDWMIHTGSARAAVISMYLWKDLPFFAILVLSGLQFISGDVYKRQKADRPFGIFELVIGTYKNNFYERLDLQRFLTPGDPI